MQSAVVGVARVASRYRWAVCGLLFLATVINYMDRQILGLLAPMLQHDIGWTQVQYGRIVMAFSAFYAIGLLGFGRVVDWLGTRVSYALAMLFWSIAAMLHAAVGSVTGFAFVRALLGIGEGGNFPAAIKTTAEWFPRRERALATGIFNSGANIGAVFAPAIIPAIALAYGWRAAFVIIGAVGLLWLVVWLAFYRPADPQALSRAFDEPRDEAEALDAANANAGAPGWGMLLRKRETWAFLIGKFLTDPVWWFYLFWLPKWLNESRGMDMQHIGLPLVCIYALTTVGSIGGGWISSTMLRSGWSVNAARKTAMLICACCVLRAADRVRLAGAEPVGRGADRRPRRRRAPGLVGEPVHDGVGHVSAPRGGVGGRHRRDGRLDRRRAVLRGDRPGAAAHGPLLGAVRDRRACVSAGARGHACAHAAHGAREARCLI